MKKFKFRAFDKKTKQVLPVLLINFFFEEIELAQEEKVEDYEELSSKGKIITRNLEDVILIQYTGIKDKDGAEIYEGDILEEANPYVVNQPKRAVVDFEYGIGKGSEPFIELAGAGWQCAWGEDCIVIGNIYQNPELSEEK